MRADTLTAGNNHPNLATTAGWWLYEHAPAPLEPLLHFGRRHLAPLLHPRLDLRSYRLADFSSGQIVAAGDGMTLSFLLQRLGRMSAAALCPTGLAGLSVALRRAAEEGDLVLAMVPRAIGRRIGRGFLRVPALVSLALEVKHDLELTLAQATTTVRRDARRVVEMGVTWTVSHALSELDQFYDNYYAPSVRQRFGELAVVRQRSMLRRQFRHGGALIWLEQSGRRIGGSVVQVRCGTLHGLVAAGLIGFVGIIVPHAIRMLAGVGYRALLPLSLIVGAGFLVLADVIARTALAPAEIPLGIVTAFFGAPFFALVLRTSRGTA